jgi:hypothetical protein
LEVEVVLYHQPPPGAAEAEREAAEAPAVVEFGANNAGGYPAHEAKGAAVMARDTLGYQYTGDDNSSRMPGDEVVDDDIVDRLGRIFKDKSAYTPCPVPEYSAARPPNEVSSRTEVGY